MPRPRIAMRKIRDVLRLSFGEELSRRQVAASLEIPTTTVAHYVARASRAGLSWPLPDELDDAALEQLLFPPTPPSTVARPEPDWSYVHTEVRKKSVTLQLVWLEYRDVHPDGYAYSQFCFHYRAWRRRVDVVMRQHHRAGEKMFVDCPGQTIPIFDPVTGAISLNAELFVAVMGASSYLYAEATRSQELAHWIAAHVGAFEFFGGVSECEC